MNSTLSCSPDTLKLGQYWRISSMSFQALCIISQTSVNWNRSNWVKFEDFVPAVTLNFQEWHWKTIGHFFYTHSSFMHHSMAIGECRFELQSGNAQIGWNLTHFGLLWPWNFTDDLKTIRHLFYTHWSFRHHFIAIGEFRFELRFGSGQIGFWPLWPWPLTSEHELLHGRHFCHW